MPRYQLGEFVLVGTEPFGRVPGKIIDLTFPEAGGYAYLVEPVYLDDSDISGKWWPESMVFPWVGR